MPEVKVAYLSHGLYYGGATTSLYLMIKSVNNQYRYKKYLFSPSCASDEMKNDFLKYCEDVIIQKIPVIYNDVFDTTPYYKVIYRSLFSPNFFLDNLKNRGVEILHINSSVLCLVLKFIKKNSNIKIVTHVREQIPKYGWGLTQKFMIERIKKFSDAIITISDNEAKYFTGHKNLHIIANPFDFSKTQEIVSNFRTENNIPDDEILVGMMGQFHAGKGHLDFLKALKIILENNSYCYPFKFAIIGVYPKNTSWKARIKRFVLGDDYRSIVLDFIKQNGLENHVLLVPYSYNIFAILKAMNIIVRPAISGDPWGRDIIESMSLKKPIIATGISNFFVEDGLTGFLVSPKDSKNLANKILELINDPIKARIFGEVGYEKVKRMCDISSFGKKMDNIYQEVLYKGRG